MKLIERLRNAGKSDSVEDSILWPFVYWPMIWVGVIHVATRIAWYLGLQ